MDTVSIKIKGHGEYRVTTMAYDAAMARYLPASPSKLRAIVEERSGQEWDHVHDVSAFIGILADWDYNVDSSPLSVYAQGW